MDDKPWFAHYAEGIPRSLEPYPSRSMYGLLELAAGRFGDSPAIAFWLPGAPVPRTITYLDLKREVDRFASALAGLGVRKGDRVGIVLPNCPQYVIAYFAAFRLGAVAVGNNPLYSERELAHQIADSGAKVVVTLDIFHRKVAAVRDEAGVTDVVVGRATDYVPWWIKGVARRKQAKVERAAGHAWPPVPAGAPVRWWREVMHGARQAVPAETVEADDVAAIVYTGGTTGSPKGAMLTHANLLANSLQGAAWFPGLSEGKESVLCLVPFFHAYGMTVTMNFSISKAAKMVIIPKFDVHTVLRAIEKERPGLFPGIPRIYQAIVDAPESVGHDLRSIRACVSGAAPLPPRLAEEFGRMTGATVVEGYGLTEMSPITHGNPIGGENRPGTIGLPLPDTDCRIVDPDDWTRPMPMGEPGELIVTGPQLMAGYLNRPDETAAAIRTDPEGRRWFVTGDIGFLDPDGYVHLVDRKKDVIIVSGFKVFPTEVEDVLMRHPAVARVCVVGVPDRHTGEAVEAFVVLRAGAHATADELIRFCADPVQGLTGYRVPRIVEFRDALPETLIGKVLRRALREEAAAQGEMVEPLTRSSR